MSLARHAPSYRMGGEGLEEIGGEIGSGPFYSGAAAAEIPGWIRKKSIRGQPATCWQPLTDWLAAAGCCVPFHSADWSKRIVGCAQPISRTNWSLARGGKTFANLSICRSFFFFGFFE